MFWLRNNKIIKNLQLVSYKTTIINEIQYVLSTRALGPSETKFLITKISFLITEHHRSVLYISNMDPLFSSHLSFQVSFLLGFLVLAGRFVSPSFELKEFRHKQLFLHIYNPTYFSNSFSLLNDFLIYLHFIFVLVFALILFHI